MSTPLSDPFDLSLARLSRQRLLTSASLADAFREIAEESAAMLTVARVSLWLFNPTRQRVECREVFPRAGDVMTGVDAVSREEFPSYLRALDEERTLAIDDAAHDLRTRELETPYLGPLHITSLLDAPIRVFGRFAGVLCHEHLGPPRIWSEAEQSYAGAVADMVALAVEADERRRAEEALRESEDRFRLASSCASDLIYEVELSTREERWFGDVEAVLGYAHGEYPARLDARAALLHPDDRDRVKANVRNALESTGRLDHRYRIRHQDGTWRHWHDRVILVRHPDGTPRKAVGCVSDVTAAVQADAERQRLSHQVNQLQKLEAVGLLASGIAHDFNNVLMAITGNADLLRYEAQESPKVVGHADEILRAAERAADVVRQLLTFSRRSPPERRLVDLAQVVRESLRLLRASLPATVRLRQELDTEVGLVMADPAQMQQVVLNLCTNASQAMPAGGTLTVSLARVDGAAASLPCPCLQLVVRDTGHGIDPALRDRVFEPFFTTKPAGKGTGLGLSVVHGIVAAHGGAIDFQSEPAEGTSFVMYLPAVEGTLPDTAPNFGGATPTGTERILVVDDEESVLQTLQGWLERLGYRVTARSSAAQALVAFQAEPNAFDLVVADLTMPHLTGMDLAWRLLQERPDVPILLMSGFTELASREGARRAGVRDLLLKPFSADQLGRAIRGVLDAAPETSGEGT